MSLHPMSEADYKAEADLEALVRAKEIERDPSRLETVRRFAETRKDEFARVVESLPGKSPRRFDGTVKNSKMTG